MRVLVSGFAWLQNRPLWCCLADMAFTREAMQPAIRPYQPFRTPHRPQISCGKPKRRPVSLSVPLSVFLPGLGVTNDPQALGPPDHFWYV